jgi:hypothetical protein
MLALAPKIRHGRMVNIDQLDSADNRVCVLCVVPEGNLAASEARTASPRQCCWRIGFTNEMLGRLVIDGARHRDSPESVIRFEPGAI